MNYDDYENDNFENDIDTGCDLSEFDDEPEFDDSDEPRDQFRDDVEADADVLASAGWGTDEDYGYYGGHEDDFC